jgi:Transglycosylase SLT domain
MQAIAFCTRCRGMRVGWNGRYIRHRLLCKEWISNSSKLLILTVLLAVLAFKFPTPNAIVFPVNSEPQIVEASIVPPPIPPAIDPAVQSMETFLKAYEVDPSHRARVAESVVASAKKHNLDPRLIASIVIVESRANPFAISVKDSIGIMQIHLPTWGRTADKEGINLFKIEDNVDFGAQILKDYVRQFGLWEGVKRYKGWLPDDAASEQDALDYVSKVQRIYQSQQPAVTTAQNF